MLEGIGASSTDGGAAAGHDQAKRHRARRGDGGGEPGTTAAVQGPTAELGADPAARRYDKDSLAEDLVFREAPPVVGGRGGGNVNEQDAGAQLVSDGTPSTFQGRYLIRHYWTGR